MAHQGISENQSRQELLARQKLLNHGLVQQKHFWELEGLKHAMKQKIA